MLRAAEPDPTRRAVVETIPVPPLSRRVEVVRRELLPAAAAALDSAAVVLGVGKGIGGPEALPAIRRAAEALGAAIGATREVTDAGWLPKQYQVGLTGRAIAPRLYVALGVSGAMEHLVGLRRAGVIVAVNKNPKAPIFRAADLGVVADWAAMLPHLEAVLRA
ncbi:MAG: electron transfer flavoprotein subunit alpha/FixB family protein [Deltaproteobacteria bacterium]|nr:MAG: electron transfer flavoprotein subunit alpha/FixB family protein [Deltaproteobacteria bacterium]